MLSANALNQRKRNNFKLNLHLIDTLLWSFELQYLYYS